MFKYIGSHWGYLFWGQLLLTAWYCIRLDEVAGHETLLSCEWARRQTPAPPNVEQLRGYEVAVPLKCYYLSNLQYWTLWSNLLVKKKAGGWLADENCLCLLRFLRLASERGMATREVIQTPPPQSIVLAGGDKSSTYFPLQDGEKRNLDHARAIVPRVSFWKMESVLGHKRPSRSVNQGCSDKFYKSKKIAGDFSEIRQ